MGASCFPRKCDPRRKGEQGNRIRRSTDKQGVTRVGNGWNSSVSQQADPGARRVSDYDTARSVSSGPITKRAGAGTSLIPAFPLPSVSHIILTAGKIFPLTGISVPIFDKDWSSNPKKYIRQRFQLQLDQSRLEAYLIS